MSQRDTRYETENKLSEKFIVRAVVDVPQIRARAKIRKWITAPAVNRGGCQRPFSQATLEPSKAFFF